MRPEERTQVAAHQRRCFNELVDAFDTPQPQEVMGRLEQIVAAARLRPGEAVLDVGTGVGVLIPLIKSYRPAVISACDLAERMLRRVREKHPDEACGGRLSLVRVMDRKHTIGDEPMPRWLEWKTAHPEVFAP